jgi:predicted phosphodiesterase
MTRKITDEQLLAALAQTNSPARLSKQFGMSVRAITVRMRNLGIPPLKHRQDARHEPIELVQYPGRIDLDVQDGVILVGSDCHYLTGVSTAAHRAFVQLTKTLRPKAVILNGDVMDNAGISRHPRTMWERRPSVAEEIEAVRVRLEEIEKVAKGIPRFWTIGNHDSRYESFLAANASAYEGIAGLTLRDQFPNWKIGWSIWVNGNVVIKHRMKGGIHATRTNTLNAGLTIVTGHLHSLKVAPLSDYNGTRFGVDTGTMADPDGGAFDYTEENPLDWRSGFIVMTFVGGRLMWPEVVHVLDDNTVDFRGCQIKV